jgi:hypothetical protein
MPNLYIALIVIVILGAILALFIWYLERSQNNLKKAFILSEKCNVSTDTIQLNNIPSLHSKLPSFVYNPSYLRTSNEYDIYSLRISSFSKTTEAEWYYDNDPAQLTSLVVLIWIDKKENTRRETVLYLKEQSRYMDHIKFVPGYEDMRLIEWKGGLYGVVNARCADQLGKARMFVVKICDIKNIPEISRMDKLDIDKIYRLEPNMGQNITKKNQDEKNWVPFIFKREKNEEWLCFIYSLCPFVVIRVERLDTDKLVAKYTSVRTPGQNSMLDNKIVFPDGDGNLSDLRGGSIAIKIDEKRWLGVCHRRRYNDEYYSFFYTFVLDETDFLSLERVSSPFKIDKNKIEFVSGIGIEKEKVMLHYGVEDKEARVSTFDLKAVSGLMRDIFSTTPNYT